MTAITFSEVYPFPSKLNITVSINQIHELTGNYIFL